MPGRSPRLSRASSASPGAKSSRFERRPRGVAGDALLVADPAHVGAGVAEHHGVGLQVADDLARVLPVVVRPAVDRPLLPRAAVVAVAAVRPVEPDLEERPVARHQLPELAAVVLEVGGPAVLRVVAVPRREVDAEGEPVPPARVGDLADHVALAAAPGAVLDGVLGELRGPQAEAVVVLGGEDEALQARRLGRARRSGRRRTSVGSKIRRGLVPVAPLLVGEGVHREVQEAVELELVPAELPRARHGAVGRGRLGRAREGGRGRGRREAPTARGRSGWAGGTWPASGTMLRRDGFSRPRLYLAVSCPASWSGGLDVPPPGGSNHVLRVDSPRPSPLSRLLALLGSAACRSAAPALSPVPPTDPGPGVIAAAPAAPEPAPAPAPLPAPQADPQAVPPEPAPVAEPAPEEEPATEPERIQKEALEACQSAEELLGRGEVEAALAAVDRAYELMLELPANGDDTYLQAKEDIRILAADLIGRVYRAGRRAAAPASTSWDLALRDRGQPARAARDPELHERRARAVPRGLSPLGPLPALDPRAPREGRPSEPAELAAARRELVQGARPLAGERARDVAVHLVDRRCATASAGTPGWTSGSTPRSPPTRRSRTSPTCTGSSATGPRPSPATTAARPGCCGCRGRRTGSTWTSGTSTSCCRARRAATCPGSSRPCRSSRIPRSTGWSFPSPTRRPRGWRRLRVERSVRLDRLDAALGLPAGTLAALNPELRRQATPRRAYELRVPAGREEALAAQIATVPEWTPPAPRVHDAPRAQRRDAVADRRPLRDERLRPHARERPAQRQPPAGRAEAAGARPRGAQATR